ncbi:hypothetical protein DFA_00435 [Cavenderia fasciculata]|uniref:Palmitoyltransferase n=1 Tax=Cavenderia fasciculata TaxID=261658 RepID=F4PRS5_CACFS|nr:uncharacterized protein DFA_00435 [Cavenderia fasciculata]EGG20574.1 hypothetical protein DFA_00435 [Cavenderia fasciculata]|eukprot:XP_004358424.1 hypothetical protein DFA_00435 [Cavenderia fasciculata]
MIKRVLGGSHNNSNNNNSLEMNNNNNNNNTIDSSSTSTFDEAVPLSPSSQSSLSSTQQQEKGSKSKPSPLGDKEALVAQIAYTAIHIVIYFVLMFREGTDLNVAIFKHFDAFYLIWSHAIFIITFYTYFKCAYTVPGFIGDNTIKGEISIDSINGIRGNINNHNINHNNNNNSTTTITTTTNNIEEMDEIDKLLDKQENQDKRDQLYYCKICDHMIPIRAKHCSKCNRCAITGFKNEATWTDWIKSNIFIFIPTMLIFSTMFMPIGLFVFHTYLIFTDQSSWEVTKRSRISYLKSISGVRYPFSQGIKKNIVAHWNQNFGVYRWSLPSDERLKELKKRKENSFNLWNNKYYSCC